MIDEIPPHYLASVQNSASNCSLPYTVSADYLLQRLVEQNERCALSGLPLAFGDRGDATATIDRIDQGFGYIEGNVRWIHQNVARIRWQVYDTDFIEMCRRCFLHSYAHATRPTIHEHFLMQAFIVALRSEDVHTKHGAVIVENATHHPIGSGYNGFFRGATVDATMTERPEKYAWMIHAEENAIANCTKNPLSLPQGASLYVTGTPCNGCLQRIINFGIKRIYVAQRQGTRLEDEATQAQQRKILTMSGAEIIDFELTNPWLRLVYLDPG